MAIEGQLCRKFSQTVFVSKISITFMAVAKVLDLGGQNGDEGGNT